MNNPVILAYSFTELGIIPGRIEKIMGYLPGTAPDPVPELIQSVLLTGEDYSDIKGIYLILNDYSLHIDKQTIRINGNIFHTGKIISAYIRGSTQILFFVFTAGKRIELQAQKYLMGGDPVRGYIYDVMGSLIVETAVDKMQESVEREMKLHGLKITSRYSPGYCGWPVSDQQKLFSLFPDKPCGIALSETSMMNPIKSVSGIIGIGKNVGKQPYICEICDAKNCIYRHDRD